MQIDVCPEAHGGIWIGRFSIYRESLHSRCTVQANASAGQSRNR